MNQYFILYYKLINIKYIANKLFLNIAFYKFISY